MSFGDRVIQQRGAGYYLQRRRPSVRTTYSVFGWPSPTPADHVALGTVQLVGSQWFARSEWVGDNHRFRTRHQAAVWLVEVHRGVPA